MVSYKKIGLLLCSVLLILQSCVTNNLDDCPEAIRYALAFEYTLHTETSNRIVEDGFDRFYDDVDKLFVYVFDATTKRCVYADTASLLAPFENNFTYPLPLNVGKYEIIVWGWGRNPGDNALKISTAIIPAITIGTSIDDARLQLEESICKGKLERIFYSEHRNVEIPAFVSRVDTLPLMNISNRIRIIIPDIKTAKLQDEVDISITANDGAYNFNSVSRSTDSYDALGYFRSGTNAPDLNVGRGNVTYLPYVTYRTDSILRADPIYLAESYNGTGRDSMLIVEISSLRLIQDNSNMEVVIKWNQRVIKFTLLELLQSGITSRVQYNLDRYHEWQLSFEISNTYVTAHIYTMDWHIVFIPKEIGGYIQ